MNPAPATEKTKGRFHKGMNLNSIKKLEEIFQGLVRKARCWQMANDYFINQGIEIFYAGQQHLCFQMFDKKKHVIVEVRARLSIQEDLGKIFSDDSYTSFFLLVPKELALKVLTLGELPNGHENVR